MAYLCLQFNEIYWLVHSLNMVTLCTVEEGREGLDGGKGELEHTMLAHLNMVVQSPVDIHYMWWARTYPAAEDVRESLIVPCKTYQALRLILEITLQVTLLNVPCSPGFVCVCGGGGWVTSQLVSSSQAPIKVAMLTV